MKYDAEFLLNIILAHDSIDKALLHIDIESIEDDKIKIICRTIENSCSQLLKELNNIR